MILSPVWLKTVGLTVNRVAALLTEEIATGRSRPIEQSQLDETERRIMRERNFNFETLGRHAKEYRELDQLTDYLDTEGQKTGYYVVSHARPNIYGKLAEQEMETIQQHKGKDIHIYLVRLGHIFSDVTIEAS